MKFSEVTTPRSKEQLAKATEEVFMMESLLPESSLSENRAIYHIPSRLVRGFLGREDILDFVNKKLSSGPSPRTVVLKGLVVKGKHRLPLNTAIE